MYVQFCALSDTHWKSDAHFWKLDACPWKPDVCRFPKRDLRIARPRGAYTIKRSLGLTGGRPPKSQKVIADMERFIEKMVKEEFTSLLARLALVHKKKRKSVGDGEEEPVGDS